MTQEEHFKKRLKEVLSHLEPVFNSAAAGEFSVDIEVPEKEDEFTELYVGLKLMADVINEKIDALKEINSELEDKVAERTKMLTEAQEVAGLGSWEMDINSYSISWSEQINKILDLDSDFVPNYENFLAIVPDLEKPRIKKIIEKGIIDGKPFSLDFTYITRSGDLKFIRGKGKGIKEQSKVVKLVGTAQDITKDKLAEERFKGLLEGAPDAMIILGKSGRIELVNLRTEHLFGYSRKELIGTSLSNLVKDDFIKNALGSLDETKFLPKQTGGETQGKTKDGTMLPLEILVSPIQPGGEGFISVSVRDVTDRKRSHEELMRAQAIAARTEELERFAHITAHNIRSPAANLKSLTVLLEKETDPGEIENISGLLGQSVDVLMRTLDDVSEVLTSSNLNLNPQKVSFEDVLEDVKTELRETLSQTDASIQHDFQCADHIYYPSAHVHNILYNLISNALRYRDSERKCLIQVESWIEAGRVNLRVEDNGQGIDLKRHGEKIFNLYKTFHNHPESRGVGLFLIHNQLKSLDGDISVKSKVGVGTEFKIIFGQINKDQQLV